jgi:hypothetical protein
MRVQGFPLRSPSLTTWALLWYSQMTVDRPFYVYMELLSPMK